MPVGAFGADLFGGAQDELVRDPEPAAGAEREALLALLLIHGRGQVVVVVDVMGMAMLMVLVLVLRWLWVVFHVLGRRGPVVPVVLVGDVGGRESRHAVAAAHIAVVAEGLQIDEGCNYDMERTS